MYILVMDLNHDYNGINELLVVGSAERLQMCKCVILSFGDLGYTDPAVPDISTALGEYTDGEGVDILKNKIYEILLVSQVVLDSEIVSIDVTSPYGDDRFHVDLQLTFGSSSFELSTTPGGI